MARSASTTIKGITIEIGGNTTKLLKSLEEVNKKSRDVQSELKGINTLLKFDPKNTELLKQKQTALAEAIDNTSTKLKKLQEAEENVQKQWDKFKNVKPILENVTKEIEKAETQLKELKKQQDEVKRKFEDGKVGKEQYDKITLSVKDCEESLKKLREQQKELSKDTINDEQYRDFQREIIATEQDLQKLEKQMKSFGSVTKQQLQAVGNDFKDVGNKMQETSQKLSKVSIVAGAALLGITKSAIDFEEAFTGVEKTVDGTTEQLANLKQGIRDMAKEIPASTTEIASVAEAAGQLGIATDDVLEFTRVMIDLGNSTNLSADEAANSLAKFSNIMGTTSDNYSRLGSTIVDLGNNFATTEADITAMAMRIAGAGKTIGLSEANVLSLATALSSVGIEAEMGGSAISKTMIKMATAVENGSDNLKEFAKVAGMSTQDFKKCFEEDAISAISKFIVGLGDTEKAGRSTLAMLSELGFDEVRLRDTMLRAANASDVFTNAINTGNKAWEENNALTNEANKRYSTTKSQMQISINKIKDLSISLGSKLLPTVQKGLTFLNKLVDGFSNMSESTQNTILKLTGLVAVATPTVSAVGKITSGVGSLITVMTKLATPSGLIVTTLGLLAGACIAASKDMNKLSEETKENIAETKKVIDEHKKLDETLKNNKKTREEAIKSVGVETGTIDVLYQKLVELEGVENKTNAQKEIMAELVKQLNDKMPELNLEYDKEKDALNKTTNAIYEQIQAQKELLKAKAAQSQLGGIMEDIVSKEMAVGEANQNEINAKNNYDNKVQERKNLEYQLENGDNRGKRGELIKKLNKIKEEESQLLEAYNNAKKDTETQRDDLTNLYQEYDNTEKYVENAYKNFDIQTKISNLAALAKKAGMTIPEELAKGMQEGSVAIPEKLEGLKKLINFEDTLKSSGMYGQKIPYSLSEGLANGKTTVEEAIKEMEAIIDFKNAEDKTQISGVAIPEKLRDGILNGELTVTEAVERANSWIEFQKANQTAIDEGHTIPESLKNSILDGKISVKDANNQMNQWIEFQKAYKDAEGAGVIVTNELAKNIENGKVKIETATKSLTNAFQQQLSSTETIGVDAAGNLIKGINNGINSKKGSSLSTIANFGASLIKSFNKSTGINSPSKETQKSAEFLLEGLNVGVTKNKSKVFKNISSFGSDVLKSLNNELNDTNAINTEFNGTRNLMMNVMTKTNPNINSSTTEEIKTLTTLMDKYMPMVIEQLKQGKNVYLDSRKVGQSIAPEVNNQLGIITSKTQRGY